MPRSGRNLCFNLYLGDGPYYEKGPIDDDAVEITTYHFVSASFPAAVVLQATATMGSNVTPMPLNINLVGDLVSVLVYICWYFI